jgi:mannose-6-phosphate isomerase
MLKAYPIRFKSILKEKIWGGSQIKKLPGKEHLPNKKWGESWELSGVKGNISIVDNGPLEGKSLTELLAEFGPELMGPKVYEKNKNEFPILVKFIDAEEDLSVQVHPNDTIAKEKHGCLGKSEMWYVMEAAPDAKLISGFNTTINAEIFSNAMKNASLISLLNEVKVENGDVFYIPAGRIHTIGKGLMIAEIQQSSDVTYRIFDFNRVDDQGKERELHIEEAKQALDYKATLEAKAAYDKSKKGLQVVVDSPYFKTEVIQLSIAESLRLEEMEMQILTVVQGEGVIHYSDCTMEIQTGEVYLIPAIMGLYTLKTDSQLKVLCTHLS